MSRRHWALAIGSWSQHGNVHLGPTGVAMTSIALVDIRVTYRHARDQFSHDQVVHVVLRIATESTLADAQQCSQYLTAF